MYGAFIFEKFFPLFPIYVNFIFKFSVVRFEFFPHFDHPRLSFTSWRPSRKCNFSIRLSDLFNNSNLLLIFNSKFLCHLYWCDPQCVLELINKIMFAYLHCICWHAPQKHSSFPHNRIYLYLCPFVIVLFPLQRCLLCWFL